MVPPAYMSALERMQDNVAPVPVAEVRAVIEDELGARIAVLFGSVEDEPLAASSVAQVHSATLRDGRPVVVKVQRPHIAETLREDLAILEKLAGAAGRWTEMGRRYGFADWVSELRHSLANEIDFELEADNLRRFAINLKNYPRLYVPSPLNDFTTSRVLTMDRIVGIKVTHVPPLRRIEHSMAAEASELMRAYLDQVFVHGLVHADPHPGNVLLMDDQRLALFDLRMVARLPPRTRRNLLKLLLGAIGGNSDQVGEISEAMGSPLEDFQHGSYRRQIDQLVSGYVGMQDAKRGFSEGRLVLELARIGAACGLRPPPEMGILGKTLLNLEAVITALDSELDVRAVVQEHLQQVMRQQALSSMSPANLASEWLDMQELARHTPQHMAAILRTLAENRLRVRIDGLEESRMVESMQKIANRVATGIIVAALVVGAALTARIKDGGQWFGLPYLSVIFLAVAAVLRINLLLSALRRDRKVNQAADRETD